ncbi:FG-GAP-like repeat-containing protein [Streptomyces indicus]|uniref:Repeat domain-containing protein n=1 Tax=Streptomyces indicus TaxID=417292 RepID=A0A1G9HIM8_9ACTN|nr:FG-GAP-like repeat-containing protein [Streptomyces indicus]SDL12841.1 Repeat domain-containing protein [Streptomyces indicus]
MFKSSLARRVTSGMAAFAASLGLVVAAGPQAAADESDRCPANSFCVFQYEGWKGEMKIITSSQTKLGTWNNRISSFVNNSGKWATAYLGENYTTTDSDIMIITDYNGAISSLGSKWNNTISSIRVGASEYEVTSGKPYMEWGSDYWGKRPAGLPAANQFGDLNNDGLSDLLERAADGRLWFLNGIRKADGSTTGKLVGGGWNAMTQLVRHGDYNGDAKEDLYARDTTGVLWFYPGRGDGTFGTRVRVGGGWNTMREISAAGDLTGDGRRDLLARDTEGVLWLYPGNGKGIFGSRKVSGTGGWNAMNRLVAPGDMNGDGKADLIARDGNRVLWLYPGLDTGKFGSRKQLPYAWPLDSPVISVGDVGGDGKSDLMRPINYQLFIYHGNGTGGIGGPWADMSWDNAPKVRVF